MLKLYFLWAPVVILFSDFQNQDKFGVETAVVVIQLVGPSERPHPGAKTSLDVMSSGLTNVKAMQFSINWDPQLLEFSGVNNFSSALGINTDVLGLKRVSEGLLGVAISAPASGNFNLPGLEKLFTLSFKVLSGADSCSLINFSNFPTSIELSVGDELVDLELTPYQLCIDEQSTSDLLNLYPQVQLSFKIITDWKHYYWQVSYLTPGKYFLNIINQTGTVVYSDILQVMNAPSEYQLYLPLKVGIYFILLKNHQSCMTKKVAIF